MKKIIKQEYRTFLNFDKLIRKISIFNNKMIKNNHDQDRKCIEFHKGHALSVEEKKPVV